MPSKQANRGFAGEQDPLDADLIAFGPHLIPPLPPSLQPPQYAAYGLLPDYFQSRSLSEILSDVSVFSPMQSEPLPSQRQGSKQSPISIEDSSESTFGRSHGQPITSNQGRSRVVDLTQLSSESEDLSQQTNQRFSFLPIPKQTSSPAAKRKRTAVSTVSMSEDNIQPWAENGSADQTSESSSDASSLTTFSSSLILRELLLQKTNEAKESASDDPSVTEEKHRSWVMGTRVSEAELVRDYLLRSRKVNRPFQMLTAEKHRFPTQGRFKEALKVPDSGYLGLHHRSDIFDESYDAVFKLLSRDKSQRRSRRPKSLRKTFRIPDSKLSRSAIKHDLAVIGGEMAEDRDHPSHPNSRHWPPPMESNTSDCQLSRCEVSKQFAELNQLFMAEPKPVIFPRNRPLYIRLSEQFSVARFRGCLGFVTCQRGQMYEVELFEFEPCYRVSAMRSEIKVIDTPKPSDRYFSQEKRNVRHSHNPKRIRRKRKRENE